MDMFLHEIQKKDLAPLWKVYQQLVLNEPGRSEPSLMWKWSEMLPLIEKSAQLVQGHDADHRVLMLKNPNFEDKIATTTNILAAFQCVNPGEETSPHRHTPAATRVILEGVGGGTFVEGKRCDMHQGDLIITPNWTWHCHKNDTDKRAIWLDILDIPLVGSLDAVFGDMQMVDDSRFAENVSQIADEAFQLGGLSPINQLENVSHSPRFRYAYEDALSAVQKAPSGEDGMRSVAYTNPLDGSSILPTHDAILCLLNQKKITSSRRSTANAICIALKGFGKSEIGSITHQWNENDVFTIPHWTWAKHEAFSDEALLIFISDRQVLEKLNLFREEIAEE